MGAWMTISKARAFRQCKFQFLLKFAHRIEVTAKPAPLLGGNILHAAVGIHAEEGHPETAENATAMLERAAEFHSQNHTTAEINRAMTYATPLWESYLLAKDCHIIPQEAAREVEFKANLWSITTYGRADWHWMEGSTHRVVDLKSGRYDAADPWLRLQFALIRAGIRVRDLTGEIRTQVISLSPPEVHEHVMDPIDYKVQLRNMRETSNAIQLEREFLPSPGNACGLCDVSAVCPHIATLIESVPF